MSIFQGMKDAKTRFDTNYIRPGRYILMINGVKLGKNRKNRQFVVINMHVLHVIDDDNGKGHKAGEEISHMLMSDNDSFLPSIKTFVANIFEVKAEEVDEAAAEAICSDKQPMANMCCEVQATLVTTQKGAPFTRVSYRRPVKDDELKEIVHPDIIKRLIPRLSA